MISYTHVPAPPLSEHIALFWHFEGYAVSHKKERLMPDGSTELVINLREDRLHTYDHNDPSKAQRYRGCLVCGPQSQPMIIDTDEQGSVMGIHFRPGGAYSFFGMPLTELHNQHVSLEELWGPMAHAFHEQLVMARDAASRFVLLERYLLKMRCQFTMTPHHPAIQFALGAMRQAMPLTIGELEAEIGLSPRRFIELFRREIGMTPKRFARLCRFQQAIAMLSEPRGEALSWVELALCCGYFDQSHFNRDFRAFAGITPSIYVEAFQQHPNHVAMFEH